MDKQVINCQFALIELTKLFGHLGAVQFFWHQIGLKLFLSLDDDR